MKFALALAIVLAAVLVCGSSVIKDNSRANLGVGYIRPGDIRLYTRRVLRNALSNTIQFEDVVWRGNNSTVRISAVQAYEVGGTQLASAWIYSGGVGWNNVTVRFQSARSRGYNYQLDIWGR